MHWFEPMHCVMCGVCVVLHVSLTVDNSRVYFDISGAVFTPQLYALAQSTRCIFGDYTVVRCVRSMVGMSPHHTTRRVMAGYVWWFAWRFAITAADASSAHGSRFCFFSILIPRCTVYDSRYSLTAAHTRWTLLARRVRRLNAVLLAAFR